MTIPQVLLHPTLIVAVLIFGALAFGLAWLEHRYFRLASVSLAGNWIAEQILLPLARLFAVLVFIALAYPVLFGIETTISFGDLLAHDSQRPHTLINVAFIAALVIPALPVFNRFPGLVLPVQGLVASAMVLAWFAAASEVRVVLWPSAGVLIFILAWAIASELLARWLVQLAGERSPRGADNDRQALLYEFVIMPLQIPMILAYSLHAGRQLAPML